VEKFDVTTVNQSQINPAYSGYIRSQWWKNSRFRHLVVRS